jgi:hypothetical protein
MNNTLRRTRIPNWFEFYREPCVICGHRGGCMINAKGDAVACIRIESDRYFSKSSSLESWLHILKPAQKKKMDITQVEQVEESNKRPDHELDIVFRTFMDCIELNQEHYEHLIGPERGLTQQQIYLRGYRSFPRNPRQVCEDMMDHIGDMLEGVPGFCERAGRYTIKGADGILIPFRNHRNEIVGFQYRINEPPNDVEWKGVPNVKARVIQQPNIVRVEKDGVVLFEQKVDFKLAYNVFGSEAENNRHLGTVRLIKGNRYYWLSSANETKGTGAGPLPVHVSVPTNMLKTWKTGTPIKAKSVWLSEGALKIDIASDLVEKLYDPLELDEVGRVFVGLPGVGSWRIVLPVLEEMEVQNVNICFDGDVIRNPEVAKHLKNCLVELKNRSYTANLVIWNEKDGKGIDNLLLNSKIPHFKRMF